MNKSIIPLVISLGIAVPLTLNLSGCVFKINENGIEQYKEDRAYKNRKKIAKIQLGSLFVDVQKKLGVADLSESYREENKVIRVLYYRTQGNAKDGITTKDECTFLQFLDEQLVEIGTGGEYIKNN